MYGLYSLLFLTSLVKATSITDIQGTSFSSPLVGQTVHNVTGVVTAKMSGSSGGFFLSGTPTVDIRRSHGLFVFTPSAAILGNVSIGDQVSLSGLVAEFRIADSPNNLRLTELTGPTNIVVLSSNNTVTPLILGKDRSPPTQAWSSLDVGPDGFLSLPNNVSLVEATNANLQPETYGLDFWESLEGQLVTIPNPTALNFETSRREFFVYGDWPVTGKNKRGGLSLNIGANGVPDANPEVLIVGAPLDGTTNPRVAVGVKLADITGVIHYQFGFYYIRPLTTPVIVSTPSSDVPVTTISTSVREARDPCVLTIGDYNVENLTPTSAHLPTIARHIAVYLGQPDLMFVQEIQDNSGVTPDGTVSANLTLTTLTNAIAALTNVTYSFVEIAPIDGADGGQPGGNIRTAYLYKSSKLKLVTGVPAGGSLDAVRVIQKRGSPSLTLNPGRIDPENPAFIDSRKPLAAQWDTGCGKSFFTVNLHLASKGGSSSTQGDARPPVNLPADARKGQMQAVGNFVESILEKDKSANIVVAGDMNEYTQSRMIFAPLHKFLTEIDEAANIPEYERYTYIFDQNTQQLDHMLISDSIKRRKVEVEHIHINNWSPTFASRTSDHDPSVAKIRLC